LLTKDLRVKRVGIEPVAAAMGLQLGLSLYRARPNVSQIAGSHTRA
jgi:hypothetical protein